MLVVLDHVWALSDHFRPLWTLKQNFGTLFSGIFFAHQAVMDVQRVKINQLSHVGHSFTPHESTQR